MHRQLNKGLPVDSRRVRLPRLIHLLNARSPELVGIRQLHLEQPSSQLHTRLQRCLRPALRLLLRQLRLQLSSARLSRRRQGLLHLCSSQQHAGYQPDMALC